MKLWQNKLFFFCRICMPHAPLSFSSSLYINWYIYTYCMYIYLYIQFTVNSQGKNVQSSYVVDRWREEATARREKKARTYGTMRESGRARPDNATLSQLCAGPGGVARGSGGRAQRERAWTWAWLTPPAKSTRPSMGPTLLRHIPVFWFAYVNKYGRAWQS